MKNFFVTIALKVRATDEMDTESVRLELDNQAIDASVCMAINQELKYGNNRNADQRLRVVGFRLMTVDPLADEDG